VPGRRPAPSECKTVRKREHVSGANGLRLGQPPVPPGRGRAIAAAPRVQQPAAAPAQARALPPQPLGAAVHGEHRVEVVLGQVAPLAGGHLDRPRDIALERDDVVCAARAGALEAQRAAAALALSSTSRWDTVCCSAHTPGHKSKLPHLLQAYQILQAVRSAACTFPRLDGWDMHKHRYLQETARRLCVAVQQYADIVAPCRVASCWAEIARAMGCVPDTLPRRGCWSMTATN